MDGKAQILELVEQAISTYDQREEWCNKLDALKEKAAIDYRKHCLVTNCRCLQKVLLDELNVEKTPWIELRLQLPTIVALSKLGIVCH